MPEPRPISTSPDAVWRDIRGLFTDIDDTLTTGGRVEARVFEAMERLRAAGLLVVPITGRPAGWCDLIARQWPVDAVVGENGAFYFRYDETGRRMIRGYADAAAERAEKRARLETIRAEVLAAVPGAAVAADQPYRETDLAIDYCEDAGPLAASEVERIVAIFERHGATAKVSSIHVNGWFGDYDKLAMTRRLMREEFAVDLEAERARFAFAGDSPNDAPMFAYFPNAAGVANLKDFLARCHAHPRWITCQERGAGFVELAQRILAVR